MSTLSNLLEVAGEAHDWLLQSPYKGKQGNGDREMADRLHDALGAFKDAPGVRSEEMIRAKLAEYEARSEQVPHTGRTILAIRIETLRWVLGEID